MHIPSYKSLYTGKLVDYDENFSVLLEHTQVIKFEYKIRDMLDYIRMWWLINRISTISLDQTVINWEIDKRAGHIGRNAYLVPLNWFLESRADMYLFGCGKYLPCFSRARRIEKDRLLVQRAVNLEYLQGAPLAEGGGAAMTVMPEGYFFANPWNGLVGFAETYKVVWAIILGIILYAPPVRHWIVVHWPW